MRKKVTLFLLLFAGFLLQVNAQKPAKPKNMFEMGVNTGAMYVGGDVKSKPGFAAGLHFRKATDYIFSVRGDILYGQSKGGDPVYSRKMESLSWLSGTLFGVLSFNNFRFDKGTRKINYYAMIGAGGNYFETVYTERKEDKIPREVAPHAGVGAGIAFRLSPRVNIGVEHQSHAILGRRADLVDGIEREGTAKTPFRDILNYTCAKISFNIGNAANQSEPLYWVNPLEDVLNDVSEIKKKQDLTFQDSDGDGVIDVIDQEPNTPSDAPVDTKGRTLDSDKDGVPDFKDKEPYYPPKAGERVNSEGIVINPITPQGGVTEERVQEMIDEALSNFNPSGGSGVADWFLPMLHFGTESYSIKYSDYGNLAGIARMMKSNSQLRLVVTGHTDQTGNEEYNDYLSYQRAKSVINHLVNNHGIGRGRLVLQWQGRTNALVPSSRSYMNRRVEFRTAGPSDYEMDPPANNGGKKSGY